MDLRIRGWPKICGQNVEGCDIAAGTEGRSVVYLCQRSSGVRVSTSILIRSSTCRYPDV